MNKRRYLLAASLLLLLLSAGYGLSSLPNQPPDPQPQPQPVTARQRQQAPQSAPPTDLPRVQLERLVKEDSPFISSGVNLFRSLQRAAPRQLAMSIPQPELSPEPVEEYDFEVEAEAPLPPPLIYLGQVRHDNQQTIFLRQEEEVFLVREGQTFGPEQEFRVLAIRPETLLVAWSGSESPVQIPLNDGESRRSRYF